MIIVNLTGGLGNQMFQYALGRHLAIKHKTTLKYHFTNALFNTSRKFALDVFNIQATEASKRDLKKLGVFSNRIFNRIFYLIDERLHFQPNQHIITEHKHFIFDPNILKLPNDIYLQGFWQNELYFRNITDIIKRDFTLKTNLDNKNSRILKVIRNTNSISIHVRRGDYVYNKSNWKKSGIVCTLNYYKKAINVMNSNVNNPRYFVFSDDIQWCKKNIKTNHDTVYIDWNQEENAYKDMYLMSHCKHNIIANSSFSWWGAWLNNNKTKIVISPQDWIYKQQQSPILKKWVVIKT